MGELVGIAILAFMFFVGSKIVGAAKGGYKNVLDQFEAQQQAQQARQQQLQSRVQVTGPPGAPGDPTSAGHRVVMPPAQRVVSRPVQAPGGRPMMARPVPAEHAGLPKVETSASPALRAMRPPGVAIPGAEAAERTAASAFAASRGAGSEQREREMARVRTHVSPRRLLGNLKAGNVEALRTAIVVSEVLGKPVSMRKPDDHLPS